MIIYIFCTKAHLPNKKQVKINKKIFNKQFNKMIIKKKILKVNKWIKFRNKTNKKVSIIKNRIILSFKKMRHKKNNFLRLLAQVNKTILALVIQYQKH